MEKEEYLETGWDQEQRHDGRKKNMMGENIRGKWKIKMNDLKSSQIIESLKLEKEIWCLSLLGFTAGSGAEKYYHRVVF